jgi:hypothetical protein
MVVEKNLRGVLRSEVDRSVSRDSIIIVDSLNNIKVRAVSNSSSYFRKSVVSYQLSINNAITVFVLSVNQSYSLHFYSLSL